MRVSAINEYILNLMDLYYKKSDIETIRDLRFEIKTYNYNWEENKIKNAVFLFLKMILTDGSHSIQNHKNEVYEKSKNNIDEFLENYSLIYDKMVELLNYGAYNGNPSEYNKLIDLDYYLHWTEAWKNELCQLSKIGKRRSLDPNCQFEEGYQYKMPNPPFIPDNDCGCEE